MTLKYASVKLDILITFEDDGKTELASQAIDVIDRIIANDDIEVAFAEVVKIGDTEEDV